MKRKRDPYLLPATCMHIKVQCQTAGVIPQCNCCIRGTGSVGEKEMCFTVM